ncbi:hypothetical protein ACIPSX_08470 [Pectobacterium sp. CHL-2024]|uniref:hypothetical protein n=1 Tax=Pectobacterium TaxID=122277 RepID=UPI001F11888D|nr:hypothetical protein [Pectobacterium carotovorum]MCH4996169.1 hypothetical protein [Pectobacterium carotovorum]
MNEKNELKIINPFIRCDLHFKEVELNNKSKKHQVIAMHNQLNIIFKSVIDKCSPLLFKHKSEKTDFKDSTLNVSYEVSFPVIEMTDEKLIISIRPHESVKNHASIYIKRLDSESEHQIDFFTIKYDTIEKGGVKDKCWQLKARENKSEPYTNINEYAVKRILSFIIINHSKMDDIYR